MIEVTCNDRLGKKVRVKCKHDWATSPDLRACLKMRMTILDGPDDTIGDLKKLVAAQTGTKWDKIVLKKWYTIFKDHITLDDCVIVEQLDGWINLVHFTYVFVSNASD